MEDRVIHFGYFVRWERLKKRWTIKRLATAAGMSDRRLQDIELQHPEPVSYENTVSRIADALGYAPDEFEQLWKNTPVPTPRKKVPAPNNVRGVLREAAAFIRAHGDRDLAQRVESLLTKRIDDRQRRADGRRDEPDGGK